MRHKESKRVTFIIITFNNEDIIEDCVKSILNQSYKNIKIIIVDNNSSDGTVKTVEKFQNIHLVVSDRNLGFTGGNNLGISVAIDEYDTDYVALINSDARLESQWTEKIIYEAELKPKGSSFQGTTLEYKDASVIDSTHIFLSRTSQATQAGWKTRYLPKIGSNVVYGVNAAACLINANFIKSQPFGARNFFDETLFMYLEDVDIAARSLIMGWYSYTVNDAIAYHIGSASSNKKPNFSLYMTYRNNLAILIKNYPLSIIIRLIPNMITTDYRTFKHLRKHNNKSASWCIYKGRIKGLALLPVFMKKRSKMRVYIKQSNKYVVWKMMENGKF